jgi:serine phosphatase RsbU (regulator of sigma subunit)/putative methionine-R-sulfoxide reductase with GAF domain
MGDTPDNAAGKTHHEPSGGKMAHARPAAPGLRPAPARRKRRARRQAELATLAEIGRAILQAQLDQDELCQLIYTLAGRIVPTHSFQLGLFEGDLYHIKVWVKDGEPQPPATFTIPEGQGIVGWLRTSHQPLLVHDFALEMGNLPARPIYISASPPRSAIFLPMLVGETAIGAISIQSPKPDAFDEDDLRLLAILANQSASALHNARLYARSARRLNDLTAVSELGRRLTSILDLDRLLEQVVELIQSRFGYYHVQIFLVERGGDRAMFKASSGQGLNEKWREEGRSLRIGRQGNSPDETVGIIGWVAEHGEPLLANDVSAEPRYRPDDPRLLPDTKAELAVPLLIEGEVIGVLDVQSTIVNAFSAGSASPGDRSGTTHLQTRVASVDNPPVNSGMASHEAGESPDSQPPVSDASIGDDLFVLQTLADQVAVAINSARAYEAQREEAWVTTVMLQVAEVTSQADTIDGVLQSAVRVIAMLAGVESTSVWLWDEDYSVFRFGAGYGLRDPSDSQEGGDLDLALLLRFLPGDWPALDQLRAGRGPVVLDVSAPLAMPEVFRGLCPGDTIALLPMLNKGEVFGVMAASFRRDRLGAFRLSTAVDGGADSGSGDARRLAMLSGLAHQVAAAVDNSRLSAMTEEAAWTSTVLLQVAEAVRRLQPVDVTLEQITQLVPALTGVDRCAALLIDGDGNWRTRTVHARRPGLAEAYRDAVIAPGELPILDDACRMGQPLIVDDVAAVESGDNPRVPAAWRQLYGSRTLLVVPLLVADEAVGALLADDVDSAHMFSPRRVRILTGIANQAAIAIENARLQTQEAERARLGRELELGHDIQRKLLPMDAPRVPGYEMAYRWRSAREVGGDFFDFVPLGKVTRPQVGAAGPSPASTTSQDERLGLVIADVSDKGIPAALYMMFARTLIRAAALSGREPADALARVNELMLADSLADMFVTVYYSVLDAREHTLTYASGGHNLAFYVPADTCGPDPMTTRGLALGIIADVEFEQKTLSLAPGDSVVFFTDGVVEIHSSQGDDFGEERLQRVVCDHRHLSAAAIADAIEAAVQAFTGDTAQYDDFTFVLVKRTAPLEQPEHDIAQSAPAGESG